LFRDITVNKIAITITVIVAVLFGLFYLSWFSYLKYYSILFSLALGVLVLLGFFFILRYLLKSVVFRRINLLYRLFRGGKDKYKELDENSSLDKVSTELAKFAFKTKEEIANLKSLSDYRKDYVGNISHELKTPIFSIQGYLHTLLEGGIHDESINTVYLKKALNNLDRLQYIVEDLDTINHLENNKNAIQLKKYDLRLQVKRVFSELENLSRDANISLQYPKDETSPLMVKADENRIHQVFYNLILNSIKYGKAGGFTKVVFHNMEDHFLIEVTDNGIGISANDLPYLFDRFYRVDQSGSRLLGGSGLGLSIVKHVLESHGETITVSSILGKGTTFNFTLKKV